MENVLQITTRRYRNVLNRQYGSVLVESLTAISLTTIIVLAMVQLALIARVRLTLEYAAHEAARSGALNNGALLPFEVNVSSFGFDITKIMTSVGGSILNTLNRESVWSGLARGMMPLYASDTLDATAVVTNWGKANTDLLKSACIEYLNPTHQSFVDWGFMEFNGPQRYVYQIPNDTLRYRKTLEYDLKDKVRSINIDPVSNEFLRGKYSFKTLAEANVLHIKVHYGYKLYIPIVNTLIIEGYKTAAYATRGKLTEFENKMLDDGKLPLTAEGVVGMQTPLIWHPFYAFGPANKNSLKETLDETGGNLPDWQQEATANFDLNDFTIPSTYLGNLVSYINNGMNAIMALPQAGLINAVSQKVGGSVAFCPAVWVKGS